METAETRLGLRLVLRKDGQTDQGQPKHREEEWRGQPDAEGSRKSDYKSLEHNQNMTAG